MTAQGERCKKDIADTESIVYDRKERKTPRRKYCLCKGETVTLGAGSSVCVRGNGNLRAQYVLYLRRKNVEPIND